MPQLYDSVTSKKKPVRKPKPPLKVYTKPPARKTMPTRSAVNSLNKEVGGRPVAKVVKKRKKADIVVGYGLGGGKHAGMFYDKSYGTHKKRPDRIRINVAGKTITPKSAFRKTLEHEIGHALGLPHNKTGANLMGYGYAEGKGRNLNKRQIRKIRGKRVAPKKVNKRIPRRKGY